MSAPSFEFFPPRNIGQMDDLTATARAFAAAGACAFSVTCGAGGSTRRGTLEMVRAIHAETGLRTVPHLSCLGQTKAQLCAAVDDIVAAGCERVMVIRGDQAEGVQTPQSGAFEHALELMELIRQRAGEALVMEVACYPETHPQSVSAQDDIRYLRMKEEAGAQVAVSQLFFDAEVFLAFRERCRGAGIGLELVPGIMPIQSLEGIERMAVRCGACVPDWVKAALQGTAPGAELQAEGAKLLAVQCQMLLDAGVSRIHFYALNRLQPTLIICEQLRWAA